MSRIRPVLLLALVALAFALGSVPSHALPGTPVLVPIPLVRCGLESAGAGETVAEALEMALDSLRDDYMITSYVVTDSRCSEIDLDPFDPDNPTEPFCSVKISACGIRRFSPFFP